MIRFADDFIKEVKNRIIGNDFVIENILYAVLSEGHVLITGVPGTAKTLMVKTVADVLGMSFNRIQFTPDLLPSDVTGITIMDEQKGKREFKFVKGPVFSNIVLADEINRTPPRTQSALLQAMQEREVTSNGITYKLPRPFFVFATRNPIEQEGTYPLPEAQLDRFLFSLNIEYPKYEEEKYIIEKNTDKDVKSVIDIGELLKMQSEIKNMPVSKKITEYIANIIRNTRPCTTTIDMVKDYVQWGAGPRAGRFLLIASCSRAFLYGRSTPDIDDVAALLIPLLSHRIILNFKGEAERITGIDIIKNIQNSL